MTKRKEQILSAKELAYDVLRDMSSEVWWNPVVIVRKVLKATGIDISNSIDKIVKEWKEKYFVRTDRSKPSLYRRASKIPQMPPGINVSHKNMWRTMRMLKNLTSEELAVQAEVSVSNAKKFLNNLKHGGYVKFENKRWRLIDDTGQMPPRFSYYQNKLIIHDRNTKEKRYEQQ